MPRLIANFQADWIAHLRSYLINVQGWQAVEVASLDDRDVRYRYFEAQRRRIAPTPRVIKIADDFSCPPEHQAGWEALQEEVRRGDNIKPRLSKRHASLLNPDGLLEEWGVHHFHLGVTRDLKDPAYVARTRQLLCAGNKSNIFRDQRLYTSELREHRHTGGYSQELAGDDQSVSVTWDYRRRMEQRAKAGAEGKNGNVFVATSDGTVFMPISGGVVASGVNLEAVRLGDYRHLRIKLGE